MGFWTLLLLVWLISILASRAGSITWWRLTVKYTGSARPTWQEALSFSWYAASGCAATQLLLGRW